MSNFFFVIYLDFVIFLFVKINPNTTNSNNDKIAIYFDNEFTVAGISSIFSLVSLLLFVSSEIIIVSGLTSKSSAKVSVITEFSTGFSDWPWGASGTTEVSIGFSTGTLDVFGILVVPSGFSAGALGVLGTSGVSPGFVSSLTLFDNTIIFSSTIIVWLSLYVTSYLTD